MMVWGLEGWITDTGAYILDRRLPNPAALSPIEDHWSAISLRTSLYAARNRGFCSDSRRRLSCPVTRRILGR